MRKGRFSGLSGVLAGTAAAIAAVGGLLGILLQLGVIGGNESNTIPDRQTTETSISDRYTTADWAAQANEICEKTNDDMDALPPPEALDPSEATGPLGEAIDIGQRQLRKLQKLRLPDENGPKVKRFLRITAQANDASEELVGALRISNITSVEVQVDTIKRHQRALKRLGRESDNLANQLGATTCAEGATFAGSDVGEG